MANLYAYDSNMLASEYFERNSLEFCATTSQKHSARFARWAGEDMGLGWPDMAIVNQKASAFWSAKARGYLAELLGDFDAE